MTLYVNEAVKKAVEEANKKLEYQHNALETISPPSEWAKDIRARVADLNELLAEAIERDVTVEIAQFSDVQERPYLRILTLAENL